MAEPPNVAARRAELADRQAVVAALLAEVQAEQLLLFEPPNLSWFAGAPLALGILDPAEQPTLVISANQRWVICSNTDSQRLFDSFLDELGFQLKEWPWHVGRDQLLADVCDNRKLACDRKVRDAISVADRLAEIRLTLSAQAQSSLRELGRDVAHALEATIRNAGPDISEEEIAGQLAHRLVHRGVEPINLHAAADGRDASDYRPGFSKRLCTKTCTLAATGHRGGLHAAAGRTVWFAEPDDVARKQFESAGQIAASREIALAGEATPAVLFNAGQKVAEVIGVEYAWRELPFGHWTAWLPVERLLLPTGTQPLVAGHAITLQTRVGAGSTLDTYLLSANGTERITADEDGPLRRYRFAGRTIDLPDVLRH